MSKNSNRTVFSSDINFDEAEFLAKIEGFQPVRRILNPKGKFVVVAIKNF